MTLRKPIARAAFGAMLAALAAFAPVTDAGAQQFPYSACPGGAYCQPGNTSGDNQLASGQQFSGTAATGFKFLDSGDNGSSTIVGPATGGGKLTLPSGSGTLLVSGTSVQAVPQGRLTNSTGVPVVGASVAAATSVFYTAYIGNQVPVNGGSGVFTLQAFTSDLSNVLANSTVGNAGPAAAANNSAYDLFVWNNGGTLTLTRGPAWTNLTTRSAGTALARISGLLTNNVSITNGPGANLGTYIGTVYTNGTATVDYIFGTAASGGGAASFGVWNMYNRHQTMTNVIDTHAAYTLTSNTVRQADASAGNQISFIVGQIEDGVSCGYQTNNATVATALAFVNVGCAFNTTTAFTGQPGQLETNTANIQVGTVGNSLGAVPILGQNIVSANEAGDNSHANTFNNSSLNTLTAEIVN